MAAARNRSALEARGVRSVLNASPVVPCFFPASFDYKTIMVFDDAEEDVASHFEVRFYMALWGDGGWEVGVGWLEGVGCGRRVFQSKASPRAALLVPSHVWLHDSWC